MIGEDGRMTAAAGERFAGHDARWRRARRSSRRCARRAGSRAHRALHARRAVLAPLRRAHRAADLAAVVHAHGRARAARRSTAVRRRARGSTPRASRRRYLDWLENIRPWCISRQLWWGHQIPVWYRGEETLRRPRAARGRGLGARPRRARHVVLARRCGRSRRSAGPSETPELRAFYPTDVLSTARDILFLWVARMVMMGLEFTGDVPFTDVYVHSVIQAPTAAGCPSRSAPASTRST